MTTPPYKRKRAGPKVDIDFPLRKVFRKQAFRPLQREIITAALEGHDIYVQAATSFGKSLCFQLPAWCSTGVTIVISPLLALVQNQVNAANNLGVPTHSITGNTPILQRKEIEADLQCGHPYTRLLYVTPELCATDNFRNILRRIHRQGQLVRIAVDEAHCISEWGHDFRPAYKQLQWLKANLQCPSVPLMALTATATPKVRRDIYRYLRLKEDSTLFFSTSIARPNIHYELQYFSESTPRDSSGDDIFPYLLAWLTSIHERRVAMLQYFRSRQPSISVPVASGIIYVNTRALAETLASKLQSHNINASAYHAGLEPYQRLKVQNQFLRVSSQQQNDVAGPDVGADDIARSFNIITATNAFGMGIDIPTIRFIVHYGLPRNLESFVQESGRAGRDGKAAQSLVLYTREERDRTVFRARMDIQKEQRNCPKPQADALLNSSFNPTPSATHPQAQVQQKMKSLEKVIEYCENTSVCRHKLISDYFGAAEVDGAARTESVVQAEIECDFACDVCKEGAAAVRRRRDRGLATDEEASQYTQAQNWDYE